MVIIVVSLTCAAYLFGTFIAICMGVLSKMINRFNLRAGLSEGGALLLYPPGPLPNKVVMINLV
jgi:hypothetical protein